jgi:hypothetical protein
MRRFTSILILLACLALRPAAPAAAWFFEGDTLVSIDGTDYTVDDFKHWWKYWNDDGRPLPPTADPYIDFLLLSREAARMELAETPDFKRQTRIFLQSRTLLMLKNEAVNSRIKVTEDAIKSRYEEQFQPLWQVQRLEFKDEETAMAAWEMLANKELAVDELLGRSAEEGGPVSSNESWVRPGRIDPGWAAIFRKMAVGEVVDPNKHNKGSVLFVLKAQKAGDEQDLAKLHDSIRSDLWKEQEDALTRKLLFQLRDKYQVKVDEERLAALDIRDYESGNFTDAPVISSNRQNVSEKEFMAVIGRLARSRGLGHGGSEADNELKLSTVNDIIAQSVTNWESLDRHYEEKEPFKWEYEFNYNHRQVLALEQRLFAPEAKVTEEEIKQHYQENLDRYTQPTVVKIYIVDETQGPIDKVWADVAVGKNFGQEVEKQFGTQAVLHETPANHLDPEVRAVVEKLDDGETSQIFKAQGIRVLVHLVERIPERPLPLERVEGSIRSGLWRQKLDQVRNSYLETLKSQSEIKVRPRKWKAIQKELGGAS